MGDENQSKSYNDSLIISNEALAVFKSIKIAINAKIKPRITLDTIQRIHF